MSVGGLRGVEKLFLTSGRSELVAVRGLSGFRKVNNRDSCP
jgi:hypothetical protein